MSGAWGGEGEEGRRDGQDNSDVASMNQQVAYMFRCGDDATLSRGRVSCRPLFSVQNYFPLLFVFSYGSKTCLSFLFLLSSAFTYIFLVLFKLLGNF